jgi:hypothetical protein
VGLLSQGLAVIFSHHQVCVKKRRGLLLWEEQRLNRFWSEKRCRNSTFTLGSKKRVLLSLAKASTQIYMVRPYTVWKKTCTIFNRVQFSLKTRVQFYVIRQQMKQKNNSCAILRNQCNQMAISLPTRCPWSEALRNMTVGTAYREDGSEHNRF